MRSSTNLTLLLAATLGATALACRETAAVAPLPSLDTKTDADGRQGGESSPPDSGSGPAGPDQHAPATPAPPTGGDTAVADPRPPAAIFTLHGIIRGREAGPDTTRSVRLPGVTANLYRVKSSDGTPIEPEVLVATAVADQLSEVTFADLVSAHYRLEVKAPPGGPFLDGSVTIAPPSARSIAVLVLLRRKG